MRRLLILLGSLALLATANAQALKNPFPDSSPLHRPAARFLEDSLKTPELREFLQSSNNDPQVYQFSVMLLANRGLSRLDNATLAEHLSAMSQLTDKLDTETCAAIFTGKPLSDPNVLYERFIAALAQLSEPTIDAWMRTTITAATAEMKKTPPPTTAPEQIAKAMQQLMQTLPADQQTRLEHAFEQTDSLSADEACWASRTFLHAALQLPTQERGIVARVIAEP